MKFIKEEEGKAYLLIHKEIDQTMAEEAMEFIYGLEFFDEVEQLIVSINCMGGSVTAGYSIFSALQNSTKKVTTKIEGIAASMAAVIFLSGGEKLMTDYSLLMIHDPMYNKQDSVNADEDKVLSKIKESLKEIISKYINSSELDQMMSEETWLDASEVKSLGIIDSIIMTEAEPEVKEEIDNLKQYPYKLYDIVNKKLNKSSYIKKYKNKQSYYMIDDNNLKDEEENLNQEDNFNQEDSTSNQEHTSNSNEDTSNEDTSNQEENISDFEKKLIRLREELEDILQKNNEKEEAFENSSAYDIIFSSSKEIQNLKKERDEYKKQLDKYKEEKENEEKREILNQSNIEVNDEEAWLKLEKDQIKNLISTIEVNKESPQVTLSGVSNNTDVDVDIEKMTQDERREFYNNHPEMYVQAYKELIKKNNK